jgi:hypothetical protein
MLLQFSVVVMRLVGDSNRFQVGDRDSCVLVAESAVYQLFLLFASCPVPAATPQVVVDVHRGTSNRIQVGD